MQIALLNSPATHFTHRIYALVHFITKKKINMSDFQNRGECTLNLKLAIPGVPEKAERWIFSTLRAESVISVYVIKSNIFRRRE